MVSGSSYLYFHELASAPDQNDGKKPDTFLQDELGNFYVKRAAFDSAFEQSQIFRFGALNTGNLGCTKLGS